PAEGNTANPTLAFGDGDSGINESTDDTLEFAIGGAARFNMNASFLFAQQTDGAGIRSSSASSTTPTIIPRRNDTDTGIGSANSNQLSLISGGIEGLRITGGGPGQPTVDAYGMVQTHGQSYS